MEFTKEPPDKPSIAPRRKSTRRAWKGKLIFVLVIGLGAWVWHWSSTRATNPGAAGSGAMGGRASGGNAPLPVGVGQAKLKDVRLWVTALGTVVPRDLVTVRTHVDGTLDRLHFREGQMVKAGQLLAEIDPRPYQVQLTQATGQLDHDLALLKNAQMDLTRYNYLWSKDSIAKQQVDTQEALVRQYQGTVAADRGQVASAKLNLTYARITAPASGRIGLRQVDPGNLLHASDANGIASIAQVQPMDVTFSVPEANLVAINQSLAKNEPLPVEAWDREQKNILANGRVLTTDNQIDLTTDTIKLKSEFPNRDGALFPNQFLNMRLLMGSAPHSLVVPSAAIQRGTNGTFVYAVGKNSSVAVVPVTAGAVDGDWTAIQGAVQPGDRVVIDGADRLRDGAKVQVIAGTSATGSAGDPAGQHPHHGSGSQPTQEASPAGSAKSIRQGDSAVTPEHRSKKEPPGHSPAAGS
ncbi:MAG: MdtA/MuxA family multidrug efflux RND transporter periplasmic adaptor subunit [Thiobacillaceae bacterium]